MTAVQKGFLFLSLMLLFVLLGIWKDGTLRLIFLGTAAAFGYAGSTLIYEDKGSKA